MKEGAVYPASFYDKGLLLPAIIKALGPLGGSVLFPFTLNETYGDRAYVSVKLVFDLTRLHEYIAQFVLPELCKAQEPDRETGNGKQDSYPITLEF